MTQSRCLNERRPERGEPTLPQIQRSRRFRNLSATSLNLRESLAHYRRSPAHAEQRAPPFPTWATAGQQALQDVLSKQTDRDRSPVAAGEAHRHRRRLQESSSGSRAASRGRLAGRSGDGICATRLHDASRSGFNIRSRRGDEAERPGIPNVSASSRRRLRLERNFETSSNSARNGPVPPATSREPRRPMPVGSGQPAL